MKLFELAFYSYTTNYQMFNLHSKRYFPLRHSIFFSHLHIKYQTELNVHFMTNYIRKDNENYKN
jgi:hypothetical protein